jgi:hypothetical protein
VRDHFLEDHRHAALRVGAALVAIGSGGGPVEGVPAGLHRGDRGVAAADVEHGLEDAGEGALTAVLADRRGADGERRLRGEGLEAGADLPRQGRADPAALGRAMGARRDHEEAWNRGAVADQSDQRRRLAADQRRVRAARVAGLDEVGHRCLRPPATSSSGVTFEGQK